MTAVSAVTAYEPCIVTDCNGVSYEKIHMTGNGFCGFNSLSYCLTGGQQDFLRIIHDCIVVFHNVPQLFHEMTDFAAKYPNSDVADYEQFMKVCTDKVLCGERLQAEEYKLCFCEDGHFLAISMLYDIAIYIYTINKQQVGSWLVYNEQGSAGYICLINCIDHFDVLISSNSCVSGNRSPPVPSYAQQVEVSFESIPCLDAILFMQQEYPMTNVWHQQPCMTSSLGSTTYSDVEQNKISDVSLSVSDDITVFKENSCVICNSQKNKKEFRVLSPTLTSSLVAACDKYCNEMLKAHLMKPHEHVLKVHNNCFRKYTHKQITYPEYFVNSSEIQDHGYSLKSKKFVCPHCAKTFNKSGGLHLHMAKSHSKKVAVNTVDNVAILSGVADSLLHKSSNVTSQGIEHDTECNLSEKLSSVQLSSALLISQSQLCMQPSSPPLVEEELNDRDNVFRRPASKRHSRRPDYLKEYCCQSTRKTSISNQTSDEDAFSNSDNHLNITMQQTFSRSRSSSLSSRSASVDQASDDNSQQSEDRSELQTSQMTTTRCQHCGKHFRNLSRHKVCRAKKLDNEDSAQKQSVPCHNFSHSVIDCRNRSNGNGSTIINMSELDMTGSHYDNSDNTSRKNHQVRSSCNMEEETDGSTEINSSADGENSLQIPSRRSARQAASKSVQSDLHGTRRKEHIAETLNEEIRKLRIKYPPYSEEEMACTQDLYLKLKSGHDELCETVDNFSTEKLSAEVIDVVRDISLIDSEGLEYKWSEEDQRRLTDLTTTSKRLETPKFPWAAPDNTTQGQYNQKRMELFHNEQLEFDIKRCTECGIHALLVGIDQLRSDKCVDCMKRDRSKNSHKKLMDQWEKVKPAETLPTTASLQPHSNNTTEVKDLTPLTPAERAVISLNPAVVVIQKHVGKAKTYRQESITFLRDPQPIWNAVLPRRDLHDSFVVIEREFKEARKRYILANPEIVRQWLQFLLQNHPEYIQLKQNNLLRLDNGAMDALSTSPELAAVVCTGNQAVTESTQTGSETLPPSADVSAGLSQVTSYIFDSNRELYLKKDHVLKLRRQGLIEIVKDDTDRQPVYDTHMPANLAFPDLFPHGETAPTDIGEHALSRKLLKKQIQWAQQDSEGKLHFPFASDPTYLMYSFARIVEMSVRSLVGWYISQRPERSNIPLKNLIDSFKDGINEDGLIDSQMPELHGLMAQIRNSRESWIDQKLSIDGISRDLGESNTFITLSFDTRSSPDVRRLIYRLESGSMNGFDKNYYEYNTDVYTKLLEKYAVQLNIYLYLKAKYFMKAFLCDICRVPDDDIALDCTNPSDRTGTGFYFGRVEFTQTRGVQHHHYLAKIPGILDTSILARMVQNMRQVRKQLKVGNIRHDKIDTAWKMIELGLLASRYLCIVAESLSTASFFKEQMHMDDYDESKVIDLKVHVDRYKVNYFAKKMEMKTNPLMRSMTDTRECCDTVFEERAAVAATSCIHSCITSICGGDEKTGSGCRFDFPKKLRKYTVPGIVDVNKDQVELHLLLRRTHERVANLNNLFLEWHRGNHDVSFLIDSCHKLRYVTKYVTKSDKICILMSEIIQQLEARSEDVVPPTIKQALSHLLLAECSHKAFMTMHELSYNALDLPKVFRSYAKVKVVAAYPRAVIIENCPSSPSGYIELSDRTDYSAYAERLRETTEVDAKITEKFGKLADMNFRTFVENINTTWISNKQQQSIHPDDLQDVEPDEADENDDAIEHEIGQGRKLRTRVINNGHWKLGLKRKPCHVRWSKVLYCQPVHLYQKVDPANATAQCRFFDLDYDRRQQLMRCYQELVCYVPWANNPDDKFIGTDDVEEEQMSDPDAGSRYSLKVLEKYFDYYITEWSKPGHGLIAPPGSQWRRENVFNYTMYLATHQNRSVHSDRAANKGLFHGEYDTVDEGTAEPEQVNLDLVDDNIDADLPSASQFMLPPDIFREVIEKQQPPSFDELHVVFPTQHRWQEKHDKARRPPVNMFLAEPPSPDPSVVFTDMQKTTIDLIVREHDSKKYDTQNPSRIFYIYGRAGSGKTAVALQLCQHFKGRVQAAAGTGKAASNFNGPTIHGAFGWGINTAYKSSTEKQQEDDRAARPVSVSNESILRDLYTNVEVWIFDEVNALGADVLARIDQAMQLLFCKKNAKTGKPISHPFGGQTVIFMGDSCQLRPVASPAVYDKTVLSEGKRLTQRSSNKQRIYVERCLHGQLLYRKYLMPNCIWFQQGHRNVGLLQEIMDRLRDGKQTEDDRIKLQYQRAKFPLFVADRGIHYSNESASNYNCRRLWDVCQSQVPPRRLHICKATYYSTGSNDVVIKSLSQIPSSKFNFAQDVLCLAEGCEVRLITNLDTAAGLVNSAIGTVVRIVYNAADARRLSEGELIPPDHIICRFKSFRGRIETTCKSREQKKSSCSLSTAADEERVFPYQDHELVNIYRQNFYPSCSNIVPDRIRKIQRDNLYRCQFPLDNSENLTAHRGQGQTWSDSSLSVHLGLQSPDSHIPPDVSAIIYVACTRARYLKDLLVDPIFPSTWKEIGKSQKDLERREHEAQLLNHAQKFATRHHFIKTFQKEIDMKPDNSGNTAEWDAMIRGEVSAIPTSRVPLEDVSTQARSLDNEIEPATLHPVSNERYIGIDQGVKTFTLVCVDRTAISLPKIVAVHQCNLQEHGFGERRSDNSCGNVLRLLTEHTPLLNWMQVSNDEELLLPRVERVHIQLEQISPLNKYCKSFGIQLGRLLQSCAPDVNTCIVQMSQPHVHRRTGPMFKLGDEVIRECKLEAPSYKYSASVEGAIVNEDNDDDVTMYDDQEETNDVEPADNCTADDRNVESAGGRQAVAQTLARKEYRKKKLMSHSLFYYFICSSSVQQSSMQVEIDSKIQQEFLNHPTRLKKLDDYGDALLHALDSVLCGSSMYQPLAPRVPLVNNNRTVVLVVLPDVTYWVTLDCIWNKITVQDFGQGVLQLEHVTFSDPGTVNLLKEQLRKQVRDLYDACTVFDVDIANENQHRLTTVSQIRIVVKQLKQYSYKKLTAAAAGSLTNATVAAMQSVCEDSMRSARVYATNTTKLGWVYQRTDERTGQVLQVVRSSGKHTNGMLVAMNWFKDNIREFILQRPMRLPKDGRVKLFNALCEVAAKPLPDGETTRHLESIHLAECALDKISTVQRKEDYLKMIYSDLMMIGFNQNQQYVSAISHNYRKHAESANGMNRKRPADEIISVNNCDGDVAADTCTCSDENVSIKCAAVKHVRKSYGPKSDVSAGLVD